MVKRGTPYSYQNHYRCPTHGWVLQDKCVDSDTGLRCPECNRRVITRPKYKKWTQYKRKMKKKEETNYMKELLILLQSDPFPFSCDSGNQG